MTAMLHHIQKSVINVLASKDPARYADLKPADMDGNQFTYHLKQLLVEKMIQQNDDKTYSLTKKGQSYLIRRYENLDEAAHTIFLVVIRHNDKLLLRRRLVQPSLGCVGFVHGEPSADESLDDSVRKRVLDKTGLELGNITVHSSGLIRIYNNHGIESFSHAIIVSAEAVSDNLTVDRDATGENFWITADQINTVEDLLPSCQDILQSLDDATSAWFDKSYDM